VKGKPFISRLTGYGLFEPKYQMLGTDIAGRVEAVGVNVQKFQPGDEVYGDISDCGFGAFAEYVCVPEKALALKPGNLTFEQAAAVPQAAVVALQGFRNRGQIQPGQKVLINGASGGIDTFAVQIAKSFEAEVTGVCSKRNMDLVRSIGADHVINYTQEDFTQNELHYDLTFDIVRAFDNSKTAH
jgi:NADPH:quinone reductase-like Zn-dependent oxidoreductase